jgi:hypothetical protein
MATSGYITGRKRYQRPQAILWSENPGTLVNGLYVPTGQEIGASSTLTAGGTNQFLILSDHNRAEMSFSSERIEKRQRTINGRMRSYHIADKMQFSTSWNNLPSRSHNAPANFDLDGLSIYDSTTGEYTSDGGAGGAEILDWYDKHTGSFWMFLAYDKYTNFGSDAAAYEHLGQYNEVVEVYFSDFNYSVIKRGGNNHDLWNISVSLEEA